ncbi:MAG: sigma-54-dependent transcriptional regulator [Rhodothermales bacterium]
MRLRIFIIEDDPDYAELLHYQLRRHSDLLVHSFTTGEAALTHLDDNPDLVFLDLVLPGQSGLETLRQIKQARPDLPVVIVSAQTDVNVALEAMRLGAYDYVTKGHDDTVKIRAIAGHVAERARLSREVHTLRAQLPARHGLEHIIGESAGMARVFRLVQKALRGDLTVAILGESGTGKELIAQAIHYNSKRRQGPFVIVNCAAIPRDLMESEFFGHEKGSFTGAHARKIGKFEQADGGTLFLDEIGELNLDLQAKLLRALQNHEIQRVGGTQTIHFDTRIICATNRDSAEMLQEGTLREDLYYRLFQYPIQLPSLRERDQDILLLAEHFRKAYLEKHPDLEPRLLSPATRRVMLQHTWPGNVRELRSTIERALLISDTPDIIPDDLMLADAPGRVPSSSLSSQDPAPPEAPSFSFEHTATPDDILPLEEVKRRAVLQAYRLCNGNIEKTAKKLDVSRSTVYRILKKMGELV